MITKPRNPERESIEEVKILQWMIKNDIHKWIVAKERGTFGYNHWQIRIQCQYNFDQMKAFWGDNAHIEEASDVYDYERKDGNFYSSEDTIDVLRCRYGEMRENQRRILDRLAGQSDRQIDTVVDKIGSTGKSHLARMLYEKGIGFYVPPTIGTAQGIIQYVASGYRNQPIIVIDIPRSTRWNNQMYVAMETLKDGLIYDTRYSAKMRNIYGVKILVFCNTKPTVSKLSSDRWRLWDAEGRALST